MELENNCKGCSALQEEVAYLRKQNGELQQKLLALVPDAMAAYHAAQQQEFKPMDHDTSVTLKSDDGKVEQTIDVENEILGH